MKVSILFFIKFLNTTLNQKKLRVFLLADKSSILTPQYRKKVLHAQERKQKSDLLAHKWEAIVSS
jgi:hypothetical protein